MKQYTICYIATAGITIEAESEDEAIRKFDSMDSFDLSVNLGANGFNITDIIDEGERA